MEKQAVAINSRKEVAARASAEIALLERHPPKPATGVSKASAMRSMPRPMTATSNFSVRATSTSRPTAEVALLTGLPNQRNYMPAHQR
jgi:hypothetical protein